MRQTTKISISSVKTYISLQEYVATVVESCSAIEDLNQQRLGLISFLERLRDKTWTDMKGVLSG